MRDKPVARHARTFLAPPHLAHCSWLVPRRRILSDSWFGQGDTLHWHSAVPIVWTNTRAGGRRVWVIPALHTWPCPRVYRSIGLVPVRQLVRSGRWAVCMPQPALPALLPHPLLNVSDPTIHHNQQISSSNKPSTRTHWHKQRVNCCKAEQPPLDHAAGANDKVDISDLY